MNPQHQYKSLHLRESRKPDGEQATTEEVVVPDENAPCVQQPQQCCSHLEHHQLTPPRLRKFIYSFSEQQQVETRSSGRGGSSTKSANPEIISTEEIEHFGHDHSLALYKVTEENGMICVICKLNLFGSCYGCKDCDCFLHESCLDLPREIKHDSHKNHPLTLLPHPAYENGKFLPTYQNGRFLCNACRDWGYGFHYHCPPCKYDLHVSCISLPQTVYRADFKYPLDRYFSIPDRKVEDALVDCGICKTVVSKRGFVYCNRGMDYIAHLSCALDEGCTKEELEDFVVEIGRKFEGVKMKC